MLLWGPIAKTLERRSSMGLPTPAWDRRVLPEPLLYSVWNGFFQLDRTRLQAAMIGPLALQETAINAWLDIHGIISYDTRIWYYELFSAMDAVRLKKLYEDHGKSTDRGSKTTHAAEIREQRSRATPDNVHM